MLKIPKKHLPLMMLLCILLTSLSAIVNADVLDRQVISAGGDHIVGSGNAITYTIGQPVVFTDPLSPLHIGGLIPDGKCDTNKEVCCDTTQGEWACVEFQGLKDSYKVGDVIQIDIAINVKVARFNRVDLWVVVQFPSGVLFFKTDRLNSFVLMEQAFKNSLETLEISQSMVDLELVPGLGGTYTFYALYVTEGANPLEHLDDLASIQRSELVIKTTELAGK